MENLSDDVLRRAAGGDLPAFEEIYRTASGFVYNVAWRIVGNREDAEEITQEVFVTVYQKLKGFNFKSSFKTWIYRVTVNCALNCAKKTGKLRRKMTEYDERFSAATVIGDTEKRIEEEYQNKMVEELLSGINPEQRACVVLRNIEGLSYEEIARTLNVNINTVRSRLKRAREKLLEWKRKGRP